MRLRFVAKIAFVILVLLMLITPNLSVFVNAYEVHSTTDSTRYLVPSLPLPAIGYASPQLGSAWPHPVSGVIHVLVIAAAFSDVNATLTIAKVKQNWFGPVSSYYHELSYGALTIQGDVYGWYTLPHTQADYGMDCNGINSPDCSGENLSFHLAQDAAALAQKDVDFSKYDYFIFLHSGYGQESSGVKNDIWSVTYMGGTNIPTKSKTIQLFSIVPELEAGDASPAGVYCLEFGHDLGLPDLYNTNNGKTILGPWELMDKGAWNGDPIGSSPAHMTAWGKIQLGYISGPTLAIAQNGTTSTYTVDPTEIASNKIHAIKIPLVLPSQYYLVEVRAQTGFDAPLPAAGVLITFVDTNLVIGEVHVIDSHPNVPNLMDAVWIAGQTFTDSANNLAISVASKNGTSYQVTVNRGSGPPPPPQNQTAKFVQLAITGINAQPAVIINPNVTVTISVQISNVGTISASNVSVQVTLDGQIFTNLQVMNVTAGSSTQASFTWISTIGAHIFQVTLDPGHMINEPSRANNVASFNLNVGTTLSINIPANAASSGNVWVMINGVRYNFNSTQLITGVSTGLVTVQIQSLINASLGVRQIFTGWSDGSSSNPRQLTVNSNIVIQATYATQYLLSINQNGGSTTPSGWQMANSVASVSANTPSSMIPNWSRLVFTSWSGDYNSNSPSISITMTKPFTLQANWIRQYYVTVTSPAGSPSGAGWYNAGANANVTVQPIVQFSNGTRDIFTGWNVPSLSQAPSLQFSVNSPTKLQALWKFQYMIQAISSYGTPQGSGWYDAGSLARISIQPEVDYNNKTRRIFTGWTGNVSSNSADLTLTANKPINVAAKWTTQYEITFKVVGLPNSTYVTINVNDQNYQIAPNKPYSAWYNQGQTLNPTTNQTVMTFFQFSNWRDSNGSNIANSITVNSPAEYTASYQFSFCIWNCKK
ncbi:MAG TPA: M6 family metalloprotease domain-containing protein [Candidatus Bathyarchaeia archaeon]|nr:M6 family metalloprotease domain-containing protein [Candidatus Bathyarchaeia archaeon]